MMKAREELEVVELRRSTIELKGESKFLLFCLCVCVERAMLLSRESTEYLAMVLRSEEALSQGSYCFSCIAVDDILRENFLKRYILLVYRARSGVPKPHSDVVLNALEALREFIESFGGGSEKLPGWVMEAVVEYTVCFFQSTLDQRYCVDRLGRKYLDRVLKDIPIMFSWALLDGEPCGLLIKPSKEDLDSINRLEYFIGSKPLSLEKLIEIMYDGGFMWFLLKLARKNVKIDKTTPSVEVFGTRFYPGYYELLNLLNRLDMAGSDIDFVVVKALEELLERRGIKGFNYVGIDRSAHVFENRGSIIPPNQLNIDRVYLNVSIYLSDLLRVRLSAKAFDNVKIEIDKYINIEPHSFADHVEYLLSFLLNVTRKWSEPIRTVAEEAIARGYTPVPERNAPRDEYYFVLTFRKEEGRIAREIEIRIDTKNDRMQLNTLVDADLAGLMIDNDMLRKAIHEEEKLNIVAASERSIRGTKVIFTNHIPVRYGSIATRYIARSCFDIVEREVEILKKLIDARSVAENRRDDLTQNSRKRNTENQIQELLHHQY